MKTFYFYIRRTHFHRRLEKIAIEAKDSHEAVNKLPPCVSWDFAT